MFDLEAAVAAWRRQATTSAKLDATTLAELEDHLREEFAAQSVDGRSAAEAWAVATGKLGEVTTLSREYAKITRLAPADRAAFRALGVMAAGAVAIAAAAMIWRGERLLAQPLLGFHVASITLGYLATLFVAAAAAYGALRRRLAARPSIAVEAAAFRWIRWGSALAAAATLVGFAFGALWAKAELGSAFSADPREVGGLFVLLTLAATTWIAWKWSALAASRGATAIAIAAGGVVLAAWFGAGGYQPGVGFRNGLLPLIGFGGLAMSLLLAAWSLRHDAAPTERA